MLKATAAAIAFIVCAYIGMRKERSLKEHAELLEIIVRELKAFEAMIRFRPKPIKEFARERNERATAPLWTTFVDEIDEHGAQDAWEMAVICAQKDGRGVGLMEKDELKLLKELGSVFKAKETDSQLRDIEAAVFTLMAKAALLRSEHAKKGKAYRSIGMIAGLVLVIILL